MAAVQNLLNWDQLQLLSWLSNEDNDTCFPNSYGFGKDNIIFTNVQGAGMKRKN